MVLVNSGFHVRKNFFEIVHNLGTHQHTAYQLCPRPKELNDVSFKGCKIISLPGAPIFILPRMAACLRSALSAAGDCASPMSSVDGS